MNKINFQDLPNETTPINATNLNQLQTNIDNAKIEHAIQIPANSDLDDYQTSGFYCVKQTSIARTIANKPEDLAFSLLVENHAGCKQTFTTYSKDEPHIYVRNFYNGTWGVWEDISPTRTITNTNGTAIKFANGTMICTKTVTLENTEITNVSGNLYSSVAQSMGNYAEEFIDAPCLNVNVTRGSGTCMIFGIAAVGKNAIGTVRFAAGSSKTINVIVDIVAIGRWK